MIRLDSDYVLVDGTEIRYFPVRVLDPAEAHS